MDKKLLFVINPVAGKARASAVLMDILNVFCRTDYAITVHITQRRSDAYRTVRDRGAGFDRIVCCGGDGTLNEVISGIMEAGLTVPLGYIPLGSTNDFAASIGIPSAHLIAAEHAVSDNMIALDIGQFRDRYFSYIASFGAFTAASYSAPQSTKNVLGHTAYILEGIKDLVNLHPEHVRVVADGVVYRGDYIFGAIANSTSLGGVIKLKSELVDMKDGLFEVVLVKAPQNLIELNKIIVSLTSSDFNNEMFDFFKTSSLEVFSDGDLSWSLDGEHVKSEHSVRIKNRYRAISFVI